MRQHPNYSTQMQRLLKMSDKSFSGGGRFLELNPNAPLIARLKSADLAFEHGDVRERLAERRAMYEPYIAALSAHLALPLPEWNRTVERPDNWEGAPWKTKRSVEHF